MKLRCLAPALLGLAVQCSVLAANDRPVEATRYVNAQGVEIFVPRAPLPVEQASAASGPASAAGKSAAASRSAPVVEPAIPSRKAATAASTAVSDEGRMDILMQELMSEQQALDVKRKAMRSPRADVDLAPAEKQKLTDDIQRHEENIRALGRELEQTRAALTASTKTAMKPAAQKSSH